MTIFAFWRNCRNWKWWWDGGGGHNKAKFMNSLNISIYVLLQIWGSMQIRWALEYVESSTMVSKFGSWAKKISTYLFTHPSLFCWIFSALFSEYAPCDLISKFCNNCTPRLCKDRGKENWWWWWRCWRDDDDDDDHHHDVVDDDSDMGVPRHNPLPPCPSSKSPLCHFVIFEPSLIVAVFMPNLYCIDGTCLCLTLSDSYSMVCKPPPDFLPAHSLKKPPKNAWPSVMQSLPSKTFLSN